MSELNQENQPLDFDYVYKKISTIDKEGVFNQNPILPSNDRTAIINHALEFIAWFIVEKNKIPTDSCDIINEPPSKQQLNITMGFKPFSDKVKERITKKPSVVSGTGFVAITMLDENNIMLQARDLWREEAIRLTGMVVEQIIPIATEILLNSTKK